MKNKVEGLIVCKNFILTKKLGTGAFGQIYLATNKNNQSEQYAAKLQDATTKHPQLFFQAKLYKYLNSQNHDKGIPRIYACTTEGQYNIMIMDLLGKSLEDLFIQSDKKFSLKTVLLLGEQMIDLIQFMHTKQFLHRDVKPDNFLMGRGKNKQKLYVIDLGLAKKYIKDGKHIPYKDSKQLTGTARYASINTHIGIQQARRDDVQSIGYVLMYFLRGILPWQNMKAKDTKQKYQLIMEKKISTPTQVLCKGYPSQFVNYLNYAKNLKFQEKPDYSYLKKLLDEVIKKNGYIRDYVYDWSTNDQKHRSRSKSDPKKFMKSEEKIKLQAKTKESMQAVNASNNKDLIKSKQKNYGSRPQRQKSIQQKKIHFETFGTKVPVTKTGTYTQNKSNKDNKQLQSSYIPPSYKINGPKISVTKP